jgi:hypothetical protein
VRDIVSLRLQDRSGMAIALGVAVPPCLSEGGAKGVRDLTIWTTARATLDIATAPLSLTHSLDIAIASYLYREITF